MGERVFACHRCGYSGPSAVDGCPRCSEPASAETASPAGGYVDLDLAEDGAEPPAGPAESAAAPRRRAGERTRPAFAPVAPVPHPTKGAAPVLAAVAAGCLALIGVGVFVAGRGEETAAPRPAATPAAAAASSAPPAPPASAADAAARPAPPRAAPPAGAGPVRAEPRRSRPASLRAEPETERSARSAPSAPTLRPGAADAPEVVPAVAREEPSPSTEPVVSTRTFTASPTAVPIPPPPSAIEEAPRHPTEGFRRPRVAEEGCVQRSIRLPRDAASRITGPVTLRFAVGTGGEVSLFQVLGDVADPRVSDALANAVRGCRFLPGADAAGVPTRLWVTMPIRFER
jgi:TonB family protein